jgi:predicted transport protein
MPLYKLTGKSIRSVKEVKFNTEKEIHEIVAFNLSLLFGNVRLIKNEYTFKNFRIDTLAYDDENNSFIIIEYKNTRSFSVVDQGMTYLSLLINNKADFVLALQESEKKYVDIKSINWDTSKVIFVSPYFTNYQLESINFKDLPIELYKISKFENENILIERIAETNSSEKVPVEVKTNQNLLINSEIKVYDEKYHLNEKPEKLIDIYQKLKDYILELDNQVSMKPTKLYIGFKINNSNFCDIRIQKNAIKLWVAIPSGKLSDNHDLFRDCSNIGHWGNGDYDTTITNDDNIERIMVTIKEAFKLSQLT